MINRLRIVTSRRYGTHSPLRYPGGKATMAGFFADLIQHLDLENPIYIEPYAGGAGAGAALLREGIIAKLVINDIDPAVYAFWYCVKYHTSWLIEQVQSIPLTLDEWKRQRNIYQEEDDTDLCPLGLAFFYLNRTNRSGILNAGVIGGKQQQGAYKIDARFNRTTLSNRINALGSLADKIVLHNLDGRDIIERYGNEPEALIYIDPPYVAAGGSLYLNAFDGRDHEALAEHIHRIPTAHWLLTYDDHSLIRHLYRDSFMADLEITYSATKPGKAKELLVAPPRVARAIMECHRETFSTYVL